MNLVNEFCSQIGKLKSWTTWLHDKYNNNLRISNRDEKQVKINNPVERLDDLMDETNTQVCW